MLELEHAALVLVSALVAELGGRVPLEIRRSICETAPKLQRVPQSPQRERPPPRLREPRPNRKREAARRRAVRKLAELEARPLEEELRELVITEAAELGEELSPHDQAETLPPVALIDATQSLFDALE
jgi:hypothetical protein